MSRDDGGSKSLARHELEEALRREGCAVCRLVESVGRSYLDGLLYESVNDPGAQKEFRASLGLCDRHAHAMLEVGDGLGTAILQRVAVRALLDVLSKPPEEDGRRSLAASLFGRREEKPVFPEPGTGCMVCRAEDGAERRYLEVLLDGAEDGSLEGKLGGPGSACMRHLSRASAMAGGRPPESLTNAAKAKLEKLRDDLDRYVWHKDHRHADEPWGEERNAWIRSVELLVGRPRA